MPYATAETEDAVMATLFPTGGRPKPLPRERAARMFSVPTTKLYRVTRTLQEALGRRDVESLGEAAVRSALEQLPLMRKPGRPPLLTPHTSGLLVATCAETGDAGLQMKGRCVRGKCLELLRALAVASSVGSARHTALTRAKAGRNFRRTALKKALDLGARLQPSLCPVWARRVCVALFATVIDAPHPLAPQPRRHPCHIPEKAVPVAQARPRGEPGGACSLQPAHQAEYAGALRPRRERVARGEAISEVQRG